MNRRSGIAVAGAIGALTLPWGACGESKGGRSGAGRDRKLPVAWDAKGRDSFAQLVTEGKRPSVYRLDAKGALVRRDARTGKVLWRRPAPAGLPWTSFRVGRSHVALTAAPPEEGASAKPGVIAALAVADGRLLWKKDHQGHGSLGVGAAGGGLYLDGGQVGPPRTEQQPAARQRPAARAGLAPCDVIALHPDTGAEISSRYHGTRFFSRGRGIQGKPACRRSAKVLDRRGGLTIVAHYVGRVSANRVTGLRLSGWADARRAKWFYIIGVGPLWRVAIQPRLGVVSASIQRTLLLYRINPDTGTVVWQKRLQGPKSCSWSAIHVRVVPGPDKRPAILAQRCGRALLLEAATGKVHWERKTDVIVAVVGERPHGWPPPLHRFGTGWRSSWYQAVNWYSPAGQRKGRTEIPNGTRELCLVPEGILVGVREADGTSMMLIDHSGRRRWSRPPSWDSWLVYPYAIIGGKVLRIATGQVVGATPKGKVLGLVPTPPILVVNDNGHLRGLRLPK